MTLHLPQIVRAILAEYPLRRDGIHGVGHWARVLENGLRLAEATGANVEVVQLFALFHDARRINESTDPGHGARGARLAERMRTVVFDLADHEFQLLYEACAGHTEGRTEGDITVQTCWDADRLDLGRVGMRPHPDKLCTEAARCEEMIRWADGRAAFDVVPDFVQSQWLHD